MGIYVGNVELGLFGPAFTGEVIQSNIFASLRRKNL